MILVVTEHGDEFQIEDADFILETKMMCETGAAEAYKWDGERYARWNGAEWEEVRFGA